MVQSFRTTSLPQYLSYSCYEKVLEFIWDMLGVMNYVQGSMVQRCNKGAFWDDDRKNAHNDNGIVFFNSVYVLIWRNDMLYLLHSPFAKTFIYCNFYCVLKHHLRSVHLTHITCFIIKKDLWKSTSMTCNRWSKVSAQNPYPPYLF